MARTLVAMTSALPRELRLSTSSTLRDAALAPATLLAYNKQLLAFLHHTRLSLSQLKRKRSSRIDRRLSSYIDYLFEHDGSYDYACQAMFGLIYRLPSLRLKLGESRLRLKGWRRLKHSRSHPPITWELCVVFAIKMAQWGYHAHAVATLLSFDCYLRVGELTRLQYSDVVWPGDPRTGSAHPTMALRLGITKTGRNQWVSLGNQQVATVLQHYLRAFPFMTDDLIFPFSPQSFRDLLRQVSVALGVGDIPYVPHSFRHGGATCDFLRGRSITDIMFRGRWAALESATRYIQTARALLILQRIPSRLNQYGLALSPHLADTMQLLLEAVPCIGMAIAGVRRLRRHIPSLWG